MSLFHQFDPLLTRTSNANPAGAAEGEQDAHAQSKSTSARSTDTHEDLLSLFFVSEPSFPPQKGNAAPVTVTEAVETSTPLSPTTQTSEGTSKGSSETTRDNDNEYDVRKTRKERIMTISDPSFNSVLCARSGVGSRAGSSTSLFSSSSNLYLDNPNFCPPPIVPSEKIKRKYEFNAEAEQRKHTLPRFNLVRHSGYIMTRFTAASLLFKRWRQSFWILYGQSYLCFFRSKDDFEEWMFNPYISRDRRIKLIKRCLDFRPAAVKSLNIDPVGKKFYRKGGTMLHFKLDKHYVYADAISAAIVGAFASLNSTDVIELHSVMVELMKLSRPHSKSYTFNGEMQQQYHRNTDREGDLRSESSFSIASGTSTRMSSAYTL